MNDQKNFSWLAISMQYHHKQTRKWEWRKISIRGLLVDSLPNSLYWYCENCMQKVRRITNEILGGKGFKITEDSVQPSYPTNIAVKRHLSQPQINSFCLRANNNHQVLVTKQIIYYDLSYLSMACQNIEKVINLITIIHSYFCVAFCTSHRVITFWQGTVSWGCTVFSELNKFSLLSFLSLLPWFLLLRWLIS